MSDALLRCDTVDVTTEGQGQRSKFTVKGGTISLFCYGYRCEVTCRLLFVEFFIPKWSYLLPLTRYKVNMSKLTAFWRGWVSLSQDFRGSGRPSGIFFGWWKTRHILLSFSEVCIILCSVVLTEYGHVTDRQTDRQMDGIAIAIVQCLQCKHLRCSTL